MSACMRNKPGCTRSSTALHAKKIYRLNPITTAPPIHAPSVF